DQARKELEGTLELAAQLSDEAIQAKTFIGFAELSEASSEFQSAIEYCMRSLAIAEKLADPALKASGHCLIGTACDRMGDYSQALEAFQKALDCVPPGSMDNATTLRELAFTLLKQGRFRDALTRAEESLRLSQKSGDKLNEMIARSVMGQTF